MTNHKSGTVGLFAVLLLFVVSLPLCLVRFCFSVTDMVLFVQYSYYVGGGRALKGGGRAPLRYDIMILWSTVVVDGYYHSRQYHSPPSLLLFIFYFFLFLFDLHSTVLV